MSVDIHHLARAEENTVHYYKRKPRQYKIVPGCRWVKLEQNRPWLGLVDLSRTPSGTFFGRSTLPRKWGANIDKIGFFRMWVIWPPKHEKRFLRKFGVRERTFLYIAALRASMRTLLQSYSANKQWEPRCSVCPRAVSPI